MAEEISSRFRRIRWLVTKIEHHHGQVDEMMVLMVRDGLGAQAYDDQHAGSTIPDPTSRGAFTTRTVVDPDGTIRDQVMWRDHRPEDDRESYWAAIARGQEAFELADTIRQRYMSANMDMWLRADPTDFCRPHWFFMHTDKDLQKVIPRRHTGDLCKECNEFRIVNGRAPEPLEAEHYSKYAKWPHRLIDPKERRAV